MNTKILSRMAFVLLAGICIAGCSSDGDDVINKETPVAPENKPNTLVLTGTLSIDTDEGTTRAVNANGQSYWSTGEKLAVRYKNTSGTYSTVQVSIALSDIKSDHDLEFSATLTNPASDLNEVLIAYPYDQLADDYKEGGGATDDQLTFNTSGIQNSQKGTIDDISANYSWAKTETAASISVNKDNNTATLSTTATLKNQNAICKFTLTTADGTTALNATKLQITLDDESTPTYTISPADATSEYYVAMQPHTGKVKLTATFTGATTNSTDSHSLTTSYLSGAADGLAVGRMIGTVNPAEQNQGYVFNNTAISTVDKQFKSGTKLLANKFYTQTVKFSDVLVPIAVVAHVGAVTNYWNKFLALAVEDVTNGENTVNPSVGSTMASTWALSHKVTIGANNYTYSSVYDKFYDIVTENEKSATDNDWSASNSATALAGTGQWRVPTVTDWRYIIQHLGDGTSATNPKGIMDYDGVYPANYSTGTTGYHNGGTSQARINNYCGNQYLQRKVYWTDSEVSGQDKKAWRCDFAYGYFEWTSTESTAYIRLVLAY